MWPWGRNRRDAEINKVLAEEKQTHSEVLEVVGMLESAISRLNAFARSESSAAADTKREPRE